MNPTSARRSTPPSGLRPRRRPSITQLAGLILLAGAAARLTRYALCFPLWGDEAFVAVNFLFRDFRGLIDPLLYGQIVPLGFTWATLAAVRLAGPSEYVLRLLPVAAGLLSLPLFWRFAAAEFGRRPAVLALGFMAAAYYPIRHANEVKAYSLDLLLSLLLLMAGWRVWQEPNSTWRWLLLIGLAAVSIWCSFPAVFVAGAVGLLLTGLCWRRRSAGTILGWMVFGSVLIGSFLLMERLYARPHAAAAAQVADIPMWTRTWPPLIEPWKLPGWLVLIHTGNMLAYPVGGKNGGSAATFVLVVIGAVAVWRSRRRAMLCLLLAPLGLNLIAAALHKYPYGGTARVALYMAPAFCLLAGVGLHALLKRLGSAARRRAGLTVAAGVFTVIALGSVVRDMAEPFKKAANYEARRVVRWLGQQIGPADQVIAFNSTSPATGHAPYLAPWRGDGAQFVYYMSRFSPVAVQWAPRAEDVHPRPGGRTWFAVYGGAEFRRKHEAYREQDADYARTHADFDTMLNAYRATLQTAFPGAAAQHHGFTLQRRDDVEWQVIDVYEYPPGIADAPPGVGDAGGGR